jgi:hypothetical protein
MALRPIQPQRKQITMRSRRRRRYRFHRAVERFAAALAEWYMIEPPRRWESFLAWYREPWQRHEIVESQLGRTLPGRVKRQESY